MSVPEQNNVSSVINNFSRYGEAFYKFAEAFYNYKFSYELVFSQLESISSTLKGARPGKSGDLQNNIKEDQFNNLVNIGNFIKTLEFNMSNIAYGKTRISNTEIPEKNKILMNNISKEDLLGFPHGWNEHIHNEFKIDIKRQKVDKNSGVVNWDVLFAKLLDIDNYGLQGIFNRTAMEYDMDLELYNYGELPGGTVFSNSEKFAKYREDCSKVFNNTPRAAMREIHRAEYVIMHTSCANRLSYLTNRFHNNNLMRNKVENTMNARQINMGEAQKQKPEPKIIDSINDITTWLKTVDLPSNDAFLVKESINDFNCVLQYLEDGDKIERWPQFFQNSANLAFMSLAMTSEARKRDKKIIEMIKEKFQVR